MTDSPAEKFDKPIPDPKTILLKIPPYQSYPVNKTNHFGILQIEFFQETIDCFCPTCKKDSTFQRIQNHLPGIHNPRGSRDIDISKMIKDDIEIDERLSFHFQDENSAPYYMQVPVEDYSLKERFFTIRYKCTRCDLQLLSFFFRIENDKLKKIGQYPSIYDLEKNTLSKYSIFLGEEKTKEFVEAIRFYANGNGIASYVYLRRVFEFVIESAHKEAYTTSGWDENEYIKARVEEKILLLKDYLPAFCVENRKVYSVLSKGIHELTESECSLYFNPIKLVIELILDQWIEKKERLEKEKEAKNKLAQIIGQIKG